MVWDRLQLVGVDVAKHHWKECDEYTGKRITSRRRGQPHVATGYSIVQTCGSKEVCLLSRAALDNSDGKYGPIPRHVPWLSTHICDFPLPIGSALN